MGSTRGPDRGWLAGRVGVVDGAIHPLLPTPPSQNPSNTMLRNVVGEVVNVGGGRGRNGWRAQLIFGRSGNPGRLQVRGTPRIVNTREGLI